MKKSAMVLAIVCLCAILEARADPLTESVQRTLKDKGFYYGEITGRKDADTTAAIRRYQIRNGLKITGELTAETQKSLGIKGNLPSARATPSSQVPRATLPPSRRVVPHENSELRDEEEVPETQREPSFQQRSRSIPEQDYSPGPELSTPATSGIFDGTPYEMARPEDQQRVIVNAQSLLARQGYYRSAIDGVFGPGMTFALRAYQTRFGIPPSGRLDHETLAVLGLLPGQRAPGLTAPRRSFQQRPEMFDPRGERIYTPR